MAGLLQHCSTGTHVRTPTSRRCARPVLLRVTGPREMDSRRLRNATPADVPTIRQRLFEERMNPLSIKPENFTVVESSDGELLAFAQLEQLAAQTGAPIYEFRSLVVRQDHRAKGIGSCLLQHVVSSCPHDIYLTTLARTSSFYQKSGFKLLQQAQIPRFLWFEFAAGTVVARFAANDQLVVMHRPRQLQHS